MPGPVPKPKNDDSVLARPLKMSRFDPPEPGPVPKCKNDDSIQGGPFKMNRFGPRTTAATTRTTTATTRTNDTAPPRRGRATRTTPWSAIPMAQRHPRDTPSSNPHGTAPPTRHAQQQSPWHSAARATRVARPTPIVTACRCVPRHSAERPTRPTQPAAAFHETSAPSSLPAPIRKSTDSLRLPATPNARPHTRFVARGHEIQPFCRPRTIHCACHADPPSSAFPSTSMHPKSHTCHAKRRSQRVKSCARATRPGTQSPRHSAADTARGHAPDMLPARTIPAACHTKRTLATRGKKPARNPIPTAQRRDTPPGTLPAHLQHGRFPQPATQNDAQVEKMRTRPTHTLAVHAAPQRERRSEPDSRTGPRFRKPRRGHPAAIIEEFKRLGRKIREQDDVT